MKYEVRSLRKEDQKDIFKLLEDISNFHPKDFQKTWDSYINNNNNNNNFSIVVAVNKRIIGFSSIFYFTRIRGGKSGVIEDVVVDSDFRGQGVGSLMIDNLCNDALNKNAFKVFLTSNDINSNFYKKLGFTSNGQSLVKYFI